MKLLQDVFETYHDLLKIAPFSISKLIPFESAFGNQCFLAYNASTLTMGDSGGGSKWRLTADGRMYRKARQDALALL